MRKNFGKKKTIKRDKKIKQNLIDQISKIKTEANEKGYTYDKFSTKVCIEQLIENKIEGANELNVSTVNRRLKESGFIIKRNKHYSEKRVIKKYEELIKADILNITYKFKLMNNLVIFTKLKEDFFIYAEKEFGFPTELTIKLLLDYELNKIGNIT